MTGYIIAPQAVIESELCSLEEKRSALAKALQSKTFGRSEQLKAFLRYICEAEAVGSGRPLTEYVIGVEVLGRAEGYSPAEDSSVRTRAYELRQKLEKLYSVEYPNEPIQIAVPKGTYTPHFVRRDEVLGVLVQGIPIESDLVIAEGFKRAGKSPVLRGWLVLTLITGALIGFVGAWVSLRATSVPPETDPILAEAWGPMAKHDGTVLLSVATPLTMVVGPLDHDVYSSHTYPVPPETALLFSHHRPLPADGRLGLTFSDNMLAVGTMNAAVTCANTLRAFGTSYQLLPERVASVSALRGRSAILVGASADSEAVSMAMQDMPLLVDFEPSLREFVIRDRGTGRLIIPKKNGSGEFDEVYGLLTVKTSWDDDRKKIQTVLLAGITSVGSQGAAEFFSSPTALRSLRAIFTESKGSVFPACYQVVVRCRFNNLLLLSCDYYTHRVVRQN